MTLLRSGVERCNVEFVTLYTESSDASFEVNDVDLIPVDRLELACNKYAELRGGPSVVAGQKLIIGYN